MEKQREEMRRRASRERQKRYFRKRVITTLGLLLDFEKAHLRHPVSRRREEDQNLIRRAKELLMDVNRMTEEEAHRFLQKRSMERGIWMAEAARWVIDSYTL